jgi:hypothetical protein
MKRIVLPLAILAAALGAVSTASAAAAPKFTNRMVTVKITGSMKTTWQAVPVADPGCQNKLGGSSGSGTETIEWTQSRALKGQLVGSGPNWGLTMLDKKNMPTSDMPISVTIDRSGSGHSVVCGKELPEATGACVGKQAFQTNAELAFLTNKRFTLDDRNVTLTNQPGLFPDCDWVWDGMVVRTGAVVMNVGMGKFDPRLLAKTKSSVSLKSHEEKRCENEDADPGVTCLTVTDWRITFYPYKTKKRGH